MSSWVSNVNRIVDHTDTVTGSPVSATTMNPIIDALAARTQYLYEQFSGVTSKSLLQLYSQPVSSSDGVSKHSLVYYDATSESFKKALLSAQLDNSQENFRPSNSAYAIGIVATELSGSSADIYTYGMISVKGILANVLDSTNLTAGVPDITSGPLFLSNFESGKLTFSPAGLMVYVGYALDANNIFLNPSPDGLNSMYFNFRFTLLDRPNFTPKLVNGIWNRDTDIAVTDILNRVGWIPWAYVPSALQALKPSFSQTPLYYYWIPFEDSTIDSDAGLPDFEKAEAKVLNRAFGPFLPGLHASLFVNGIALPYKRTSTDNGLWCLNNAGLWWYGGVSNVATDGIQPWDSNINRNITATVNTTDDTLTLKYADTALTCASLGLAAGSPIRFVKGLAALDDSNVDTTMPTIDGGSLAEYTTYYVKTITDNVITISATLNGEKINFTAGAVGGPLYVQFDPGLWIDNSSPASARGRRNSRPTMVIQFVKAAPDLKDIVVTSLQANTGAVKKASGVLEFVDSTTLNPAAHGDLTVLFDLPFVKKLQVADTSVALPTDSPYSSVVAYTGQAIKSLSWDNTAAVMNVQEGPVVTKIIGQGGIQTTTNAVTGECSLSFDSAYSNLIVSVEPENSRLEYYGLHSFLSLDTSTGPSGYIGKFLLPENLPSVSSAASLKLTLYGFLKSDPSSGNELKFKFEYAITKPNTLIQSVVVSPTVNNTVSAISYSLTGKKKDMVYLFEIPSFSIPISELVGHGFVNFRIQRLKLTSGYIQPFCVLGTYWSIS